jgi:hypothetical protein
MRLYSPCSEWSSFYILTHFASTQALNICKHMLLNAFSISMWCFCMQRQAFTCYIHEIARKCADHNSLFQVLIWISSQLKQSGSVPQMPSALSTKSLYWPGLRSVLLGGLSNAWNWPYAIASAPLTFKCAHYLHSTVVACAHRMSTWMDLCLVSFVHWHPCVS